MKASGKIAGTGKGGAYMSESHLKQSVKTVLNKILHLLSSASNT
jgi:hypothetical protein